MTEERNSILPENAAREFAAFILYELEPYLPVRPETRVAEIVARKVFEEALRVAEQVDFGEGG